MRRDSTEAGRAEERRGNIQLVGQRVFPDSGTAEHLLQRLRQGPAVPVIYENGVGHRQWAFFFVQVR